MLPGSPDKATPLSVDSVGGRERLPSRYRRLWLISVFFTAFVSLTPLVIMTSVNVYQYRKALRAEIIHPIARLASNSRRFIEDFLHERRAALTYVANTQTYEDLCDSKKLQEIFLHLKKSFGGFIDLGVIDADGNQCSYVGRYELEGKNYIDQDWYHEVSIRGVYVSDVFLGYRNFPHFVVAVRKDDETGGGYHVLRATVDTDVLSRHIISLDLRPSSDAFLINREGILQTPSRRLGRILDPSPIPTPAVSPKTEVLEVTSKMGEPMVLGYAYIKESPFIFVVLEHPERLMEGWLYLRSDMLWLLGLSVVVILAVILGSCTYLVRRVRDADFRRDKALHNIEYTNKMASIGRMAAGVAHEINNPLAIIGENAGLLKDLVALGDKPPERERLIKITETIAKSVDRCSTITHRLLGFAKRMDPLTEQIRIRELLEEVVSFQGKEPEYRNITITLDVPEDLPTLVSDRGQLQQVFLNILSNAIAAVDDGGVIGINVELESPNRLAVTITDNGPGIPEAHLTRIFEPFFSTKAEYGTGLGLSITFGIVEKLGGRIDVSSRAGEGASFTVHLPVTRQS
jgi:signal transduction histidine kinase